MSEHNGQNGAKPQQTPEGITKITVGGYKSIAQEQNIEIRPLTILAGANSSGKSSIMQPLLLMKQTLEAPYDPGALLLNGPNVRFTSAKQLFSRIRSTSGSESFQVGIATRDGSFKKLSYSKQTNEAFEVEEMAMGNEKEIVFKLGMSSAEIINMLNNFGDAALNDESLSGCSLHVVRNRCFLEIGVKNDSITTPISTRAYIQASNISAESFSSREERSVLGIIHLPGLRGNPARTYPATASSEVFPGTFDNYTASVIAQWNTEHQIERVTALDNNLLKLGLTSRVSVDHLDDTQLEIRVVRSRIGTDTVSIADVGIGVSQTLPVLVALLAAKPGQLVYLEQPEIHLHPRAQTAMAQVLADAAMRGVRVVAETHSSLLLLGVQTLVAEGKLPPELVKLHWFERGDDGATTIRSADLDEGGRFGDWPEDFGDVSLDAQSRYLDAAEQQMVGV